MQFIKRIFNVSLLSLLTLMIGINQSVHADLNIPNVPIFVGTNIQPNIMMAVDDSGSMNWEIIKSPIADAVPEYNSYRRCIVGGADCTSSGILDYTPTDTDDDELMESCAAYNTMYYNPNVTYTPWIGEDDAGQTFTDQSITAARNNPYLSNSGSRNLTLSDGGGDPSGYIPWNDADNDGEYDIGECGDTPTAPVGSKVDYSRFIPVSAMPAAEQTNFANWYTYYRKRDYVLKRVMSELIDESTFRIGLATLHNRDSVGTPVRDMTNVADKEALEDNIFRIRPNSGTPLRSLLDNVGRYYDDTDGANAPSALGFTESSPILSSTLGGQCQQNYTVLMSDGFWNGTIPNGNLPGNADGDANTVITVEVNGNPKTVNLDGGPHADAQSNTLADVAMKYYENDLSNLANEVPIIPIVDENDRQHMVTYTVAFGLTGTLPEGSTPTDHEFTTLAPNQPTGWPAVTPTGNDTSTLDDMQHAAYNGRGEYLTARDPLGLITSLTATFADIGSRNSFSGTSVAVNSTILRTDSLVYTAGFDSEDYTGSLEAFPIATDGTIGTTEIWNAATVAGLNRTTTAGNTTGAITARTNIYTIVNKSGTDTPVQFSSADADLVAATVPPIVPPATTPAFPGSDVINYIAGDWSREQNNTANAPNNTFRNREDTLLGDIVSSTPVIAGPDDFGFDILPGTEGNQYQAYLNNKRTTYATSNNSNSLVLVGANDGMLHAIRSLNTDGTGDGSEIFAYVPKTVHDKLHLLTDPNYGHEFYVNSTGFAGDAFVSGDWRTLYVSALGEGGRGIFALDITNPFATNNNPALWERSSTDTGFDQIGFITHRPVIVRLNNGRWGVVFGNGYNSGSGTPENNKAQIFILDAEDGSIIRRFDTNRGGSAAVNNGVANGMAEPFVLDEDGDRIADFIYAGDLLGNMWKIDISSTNDAAWDFSFGSATSPEPLYSAVETNGTPQPITSRPSLARDPNGGLMILFGTGKFIEPNDNFLNNPVARNSFYAIRDRLNGARPAPARQNKVEQTIDDVISQNNITGQVVTGRVISDNAVSDTDDGWYIDFTIEDGERFISNSSVRFGNVLFASYIPSGTPCDFDGSSFIMALDALSGAQLQGSFFDFNNDGTIDSNDFLDNGGGQQIGSGIKVSGTVGGLGVVLTEGGQDRILTSKLDGGGLENTLSAGGDLILGRTSWRQIE